MHFHVGAEYAGLHQSIQVCPHEMLQNHPIRIEGVKVQNKSCQRRGELLRVAASSTPSLNRTRNGVPRLGLISFWPRRGTPLRAG